MNFRDLVPWGFGKSYPLARTMEDFPLSGLQKGVNNILEGFFKGFDAYPFEGLHGRFSPRINVTDTDKEIVVSAELPGIDEKDIDISLTDDSITLKGEKKEEKEEKGKGYYHVESSYGSFSRTIPLPCEIVADKVEASFKKGVLTITLPKTAEAVKETKKITIKTE
ncbi:MAG: Hsp20/alpha crystallin family protein [Nitrospirae bacterium]|nr:Hsp20/alpha crystallin family protein [Nitrospirota bacterium]